MISATDWVLSGPHAFICDKCQLYSSHPYHLNRWYGKCYRCGNVGYHQVFRTGHTTEEVFSGCVCFLFWAGVIAAVWYAWTHPN